MRFLITRPREDSERVASHLKKLGFEADIEPLLSIRYLDLPLSLSGATALIFTSANGVRAFARLETSRHWPVFAVGEQTRRMALDLGFSEVLSAQGDVTALIHLIENHVSAKEAKLFHAAGTHGTGPLQDRLRKKGHHIIRQALYEAEAVTEFSSNTQKMLSQGEYKGVLFFSPRTAAIFAKLCQEAGITELPKTNALALSQAITDKLASIRFAKVKIANEPNLPSLMATLAAIIQEG